jgi:hypothetical protein
MIDNDKLDLCYAVLNDLRPRVEQVISDISRLERSANLLTEQFHELKNEIAKEKIVVWDRLTALSKDFTQSNTTLGELKWKADTAQDSIDIVAKDVGLIGKYLNAIGSLKLGVNK